MTRRFERWKPNTEMPPDDRRKPLLVKHLVYSVSVPDAQRITGMTDAQDRADYKMGGWLSAALEDPTVCAEMKADINAWFEAHQPGLIMPDLAATPAVGEEFFAKHHMTPDEMVALMMHWQNRALKAEAAQMASQLRGNICCYCDVPLFCARCGMEQPDDTSGPHASSIGIQK